jgi:hypothetical protein
VKDLYKEIYKSLKKEIQEDYKRWEDLPCSWIGRINKVEMAIIIKSIYIFSIIPNKISITFTTEIEKSTLRSIWICQLYIRQGTDNKNIQGT